MKKMIITNFALIVFFAVIILALGNVFNNNEYVLMLDNVYHSADENPKDGSIVERIRYGSLQHVEVFSSTVQKSGQHYKEFFVSADLVVGLGDVVAIGDFLDEQQNVESDINGFVARIIPESEGKTVVVDSFSNYEFSISIDFVDNLLYKRVKDGDYADIYFLSVGMVERASIEEMNFKIEKKEYHIRFSNIEALGVLLDGMLIEVGIVFEIIPASFYLSTNCIKDMDGDLLTLEHLAGDTFFEITINTFKFVGSYVIIANKDLNMDMVFKYFVR